MWIPQYKYQLLEWFKKCKSEWKQYKLKKMSKKQLYAIYFELRKGEK